MYGNYTAEFLVLIRPPFLLNLLDFAFAYVYVYGYGYVYLWPEVCIE